MSQGAIRSIPNVLSLSRLGLALSFPFLHSAYHLAVIYLALASEFLDGYLARRLHAESRFGQLLDPIADKLFVFSVIWVLLRDGRIRWWEFALVSARDITVLVGTIILLVRWRSTSAHDLLPQLKPRASGKTATALQFLWLISAHLNLGVERALMVSTIFVSCLSAVDYLKATRSMSSSSCGRNDASEK